ncbi:MULTISPECIES: PP2C family protein-serine/threonine phosphatase [Streptomyces]|uniref:Serine/threonine-protein phosphatase n=1 Tax=Streptomyces xinghaiensis TaxID=1038928 RepID=A0A3R7EZW7_9ACTN|nr:MULTISPECIES: PP2C family serine/threonine-protein phosphatase [Streptomyces]PQM25375.1 serine/threonine-protein phosphatase [Streptomyces xinghaiensis]RKM99430.1 serine/threonine-protein phosphatase [Streptomyces xinghaiensis]RNC76503.1 serine/threonine-protein phosphatase [Streptomyces xinghaiensis]
MAPPPPESPAGPGLSAAADGPASARPASGRPPAAPPTGPGPGTAPGTGAAGAAAGTTNAPGAPVPPGDDPPPALSVRSPMEPDDYPLAAPRSAPAADPRALWTPDAHHSADDHGTGGPGPQGSNGSHGEEQPDHPADAAGTRPRETPAPAAPETPTPETPAAGTAGATAGAADGTAGAPADTGATAGPAAGAPGGSGNPGTLCVACRKGTVGRDGHCEHCGHAQPRERDHVESELAGAVAAVTDRGLRHHRNEDAFALCETALPDGTPAVAAVVCDGVSSATRPDEASAAAAAAARESLPAALRSGTPVRQALHDALVAAGTAVTTLSGVDGKNYRYGEPRPHQNAPACTIVSALLSGDELTVGWIGDSRVYWVPDDRTAPARLTEDDSWAAQMVAGGLLTEREAYADPRAHAITGWLGADAYELAPHIATFLPDRPGVVIVCTDGLWNYAESAGEMALAVPADARTRPLHAAQSLVGYALDGGGHDNVTVAVLPFAGAPSGAAEPAGGADTAGEATA